MTIASPPDSGTSGRSWSGKMSRIRVVVLGGSGMLGAMVVDVLARDPQLEVCATVRRARWLEEGRRRLPDVDWKLYVAGGADGDLSFASLRDAQWVVNCIGVTKPFIRDDRPDEVERAIRVNALWPHTLGRWAVSKGVRVLQIATDCVFSGMTGGYTESHPHDPLDVYGKTKSLGEVAYPGVHHLRCSIVGPEADGGRFLLEWFRRQPPGARVTGYANHRWNGLTTLHFARVCLAVIRRGIELPPVQHVVPADVVTKAELLRIFARHFDRADVQVVEGNAPASVDRSLATNNSELNRILWTEAGYIAPPTIEQMVQELSGFDFRMAPQS